mmetsp:Transcript_10643/g.21866  ORF Transcript_10643/g.21866 Transcript_10643/m.21866 type:complete len:208 (+) Transcript_10643:389-1012(+)|eukprot:CAMPEP_0172452894 /NCGR_PEP_ID=MMETSP1065-20121228/10419_1 /TAXON_ID=265537 /ORGANISM="Amphiprora paludosa, Strain CCMP125" /LENGTH=207 /DNA_ID=CAMNT_0013205025 /DNA_START=381 /DNA_END=1004 /DNA_ORIENTATION=+
MFSIAQDAISVFGCWNLNGNECLSRRTIGSGVAVTLTSSLGAFLIETKMFVLSARIDPVAATVNFIEPTFHSLAKHSCNLVGQGIFSAFAIEEYPILSGGSLSCPSIDINKMGCTTINSATSDEVASSKFNRSLSVAMTLFPPFAKIFTISDSAKIFSPEAANCKRLVKEGFPPFLVKTELESNIMAKDSPASFSVSFKCGGILIAT